MLCRSCHIVSYKGVLVNWTQMTMLYFTTSYSCEVSSGLSWDAVMLIVFEDRELIILCLFPRQHFLIELSLSFILLYFLFWLLSPSLFLPCSLFLYILSLLLTYCHLRFHLWFIPIPFFSFAFSSQQNKRPLSLFSTFSLSIHHLSDFISFPLWVAYQST